MSKRRARRFRPRFWRKRRGEGMIYMLLRVQMLRVALVMHLRVAAHVLHVRLCVNWAGTCASASLERRARWATLLLELRWHVGPTLRSGHRAVAGSRRAHERRLRVGVASTSTAALLVERRTRHVNARVADLGLHRLRRRSAFVHRQSSHVRLLGDLAAHLWAWSAKMQNSKCKMHHDAGMSEANYLQCHCQQVENQRQDRCSVH